MEQTQLALSRTPVSVNPNTKYNTVKDGTPAQDPDLAYLIDRWPGLPKETKQAIMTLAAGQEENPQI